jgi:hypothetical protein
MFLITMIRFALTALTTAINAWKWLNTPAAPPALPAGSGLRPHRRYLLSDEGDVFEESMTRVPEYAIYVEEWFDTHGNKRCRILYDGEEIPHSWTSSPFDKEPKRPWVWIGNAASEIDLTRTFDKYLVVGNKITPEFLSHILPGRNVAYMDPVTFNQHEFPEQGITIEENV